MSKKLFHTLSLIITLSVLAEAHEFWLQPDKFFYAVGDSLRVGFKTGNNFVAETSATVAIEKIEFHTSHSVADLTSKFASQKENILLPLTTEGTGVITSQTASQLVTSTAEAFNTYLKEEGLDDAFYKRETIGALNVPGKENVAYYTKLIVQVGEKRDDGFKKIMGWPIEIIPEKNPYTLIVGEVVKFKILSNGKPLFGAKVKVWNRENNRTLIQPVYTQQDGTIEARISNKGAWMVSVTKINPSNLNGGDWQSYKGSLVFGAK